MDVRPAPVWAELAPLFAIDGDVYAPVPTSGEIGRHVAEVVVTEDEDAAAEMFAAAPSWALILRIVAGGGTLSVEPEGELILRIPIDGYVDPISIAHGIPVEAFEEIPISVDTHGLPVLPAHLYRELARLVGWPVAPAPSP